MAQLIQMKMALVSTLPIRLTRAPDSETNHSQEGQSAHSVGTVVASAQDHLSGDGGTTEEQVNA